MAHQNNDPVSPNEGNIFINNEKLSQNVLVFLKIIAIIKIKIMRNVFELR